jgi:predicted transcriptional regulator
MREKKRQNARRYYGLASFKREIVVKYIVQHYHVDKTLAQIAARFDVTPPAISRRIKSMEKEGFVFPPKPTITKLALNNLKHQ